MKFKIASFVAASALMAGSAALAGNDVFIEQYGADNKAVADQIGDSNVTSVYQDGARNEYGLGNDPAGNWGAHQDGSGNTIDATQLGEDNKLGRVAIQQRNSGNALITYQSGSNNLVNRMSQKGSNDRMVINQTGVRNFGSNLTQTHGSLNRMRITQIGFENGRQDVTGVHGIDGTSKVGPVDLAIDSKGIRTAFASQIGDGNIMTVHQDGANNGFNLSQGDFGDESIGSVFRLEQYGVNNYTWGRQVGVNQRSIVNQAGAANLAVVSQQ